MQAKSRRKPKFLRQEWFRMGNQRKKWLKWRRVRGGQSKLRQHIRGKGFRPHPGYGVPTELRYLHPSGLKEVIVNNVAELKLLDAKTCVARIAGGVGNRKRLELQAEAEKMKVRVLNPRKIEPKAKKEAPKAEEKPEKKTTKEKGAKK
jgi:large subunit ribosomal protein L32e